MIIWDIKECHLDTIFEYDEHLVVHYKMISFTEK
jgi:hypothetical protein